MYRRLRSTLAFAVGSVLADEGLCDTISMSRRLPSLPRVDKIEVGGEGEAGPKKVVRVEGGEGVRWVLP